MLLVQTEFSELVTLFFLHSQYCTYFEIKTILLCTMTDVIWLLNLKEFIAKWCPAEQYCRIAQRMLGNLKGSHFYRGTAQLQAVCSSKVKVSSHSAPAEHSKWKCVKIGATWAFRCTLLEVSSGRLRFREQLTYLLPFHHDVSSLL